MMTRGLSRFLQATSALRGGERGLALIEFALIFPVMLFLFLGLVEFGEAFSLNRKIENAASTVSDLVSQESKVTCAQLADIATIANEIIKPYRPAPFSLRISSIVADENNNLEVAWTYPTGGGSPSFDFPAGLTEPGSSLIVAETAYEFTPTIGYFIGSITLNGKGYFRPRLTRIVEGSDCG